MRAGHAIALVGALALVMIDNPMCPGTGHRICNDCMKACIYQRQDPVDIPQFQYVDLDALMAINTDPLTSAPNVPDAAAQPLPVGRHRY